MTPLLPALLLAASPVLELPPEPAAPPPSLAVTARGGGVHEVRFPIMGTVAELTLHAPDPGTARAAGEAAQAELRRVDALMSEWRADSPLSAVNAAAGRARVEVPSELFDLITRSLEVAARSGGTFDPTWAALRGLWRFGDTQDGTVPTDAAIEAARAKVSWRKVRLDLARRTVFLPEPGMALGLGGIAKGYAVDRVVAEVRRLGLRDFVVRVGGDLYASGRNGDRPWRIGVRDPRRTDQVFATIALSDSAFSTSGDYERFFVKDGVRYHHVIDPRTARPATASRSVTARCKDAETADVVTKPVFVLGPAEGVAFAAALGCEVLIVDAAGKVHGTPSLLAELELRPLSP